jgi:hypothetical protein
VKVLAEGVADIRSRGVDGASTWEANGKDKMLFSWALSIVTDM